MPHIQGASANTCGTSMGYLLSQHPKAMLSPVSAEEGSVRADEKHRGLDGESYDRKSQGRSEYQHKTAAHLDPLICEAARARSELFLRFASVGMACTILFSE